MIQKLNISLEQIESINLAEKIAVHLFFGKICNLFGYF